MKRTMTLNEVKHLLARHKECTFSADRLFAEALDCIQQLEKKNQLLEARNDTLVAKAALFDEALSAGAKMECERDNALGRLSSLLSYVTGGRFSDPSCSLDDMKRSVDSCRGSQEGSAAEPEQQNCAMSAE